MKKHELMIAFLNAKTCVKKLMRLKCKKDLVSIQGFYNPNVSLSLLVEHVYYHTDILSEKIK